MANKLNAETIIVTNGEDIKKVTRKAFNVIYKRLGYMEVPEDVEVSKDVKAKTSTRKNSTKKG